MDAALTPLAAIPSPTQGVWEIGPLPLRAYALCIVLGIVAACFIADRRLRHRGAPPWVILDIAVWAVPTGIIGARLYHVITSPEAYFGDNGDLIKAFKIWEGGLGIWGGIAGGAVGAYIACRRMNMPFAMAADTLAVGLPVAQALGRWGNWFNNELYGKATDLPWGLKVYTWDAKAGHAQIVNGEPMPLGTFHPTFLYEFLWCLGVAAVVWYVDKRWSLGRGRAFALYVALYCAGRFWIEALRIDDAHHFLGMRLNNWTSLIVFAAALAYFLLVRGPQERVTYDENGRLTPVTGAEPSFEPSAVSAPASSDDSDSSDSSDSSDAADSSDRISLEKPDESDSVDADGGEDAEAGDAEEPSGSTSDSSSASTSGKG
ncbi:prolipoprotein diacylglyceryl transferase [Dactylosporangium sp. NPDC000521]|uniref:prolipoprotein diacylglyceryl transferase n=1 Tax=Dactylosporangium sp. NPDC000521 TaxID=3363975 RepID=UPI0036B26AA8